MDNNKYISAKEASRLTGLSVPEIYRLIFSGSLPARKAASGRCHIQYQALADLGIILSKPYKGASDVNLNWDAVRSFIKDADAKEKLSPEAKAAAIARKSDHVVKETPQTKQSNYPVSLKMVSSDSGGQSVTESSKTTCLQSEATTLKTKESLTDIVADIVSCDSIRDRLRISALGRIHCTLDGRDEFYWFTNDSVNFIKYPELKRFGHFIHKNSDIAIRIQTTELGNPFDYPHYNEIKRYVKSVVCVENRSDFQNHTIGIAGDDILYQYRDIYEFLDALKENREEILDVESHIKDLYRQIEELKQQKNTAHERSSLTRSINAYKKEYRILTQQQEDLKNITIYIRKQDEMRYTQIVDTIQTRIKSQNLFDGSTVIIKGGPGTGKSTTMIHRLGYLTDVIAIKEDERNKTNRFNLNPSQRRKLLNAIDTQRDWMFFSPSQLLKDYLAVAMTKEGLKNVSQKVWNWKDYRKIILQENYQLLGPATSDSPFKDCLLIDTLFYQGSNIIEELNNFYLSQLREIRLTLPNIEVEGNIYAWTSIAINIKKRFEESEHYSIGQFLSLFISLESVYGEDCKGLLREKNDAIQSLAIEICKLLDDNQAVRSDLEDIFELTSESEDISNENEELEDAEGEQVVENSSTGILSWFKSFADKKDKPVLNDPLIKELQKWIKAYCNHKINNGKKLSDENQLITDAILPILGNGYDDRIKKICELTLFEQYARYTRGIKSNMLIGLPAIYKKFRSYLIKSKFEGCNLSLLRDIMRRSQGKELHHQEQSLLLGFINSLVKLILASTKDNIKHAYFEAYEEVSRPIIGIDEATDFSACDIYAMQSLLSRDFSSLTLCGDKMQRLTPHGIKSWKELDNIVPNSRPIEMVTSYRQSKKLLDVAKQLYEDTLNETPSYKPFMKSNKVPVPLSFVSVDEFSKVKWISARISEIYRAYGEVLPSIAIFVNDKGYVPKFTVMLQGTDFFAKNKIQVLDGTKSTPESAERHICVYPINVVKGMEFDVVFFHNIDNSAEDMDTLKRYIYVGVSRAAFFLGITLNEYNQEICKYFEQNKDWFKI